MQNPRNAAQRLVDGLSSSSRTVQQEFTAAQEKFRGVAKDYSVGTAEYDTALQQLTRARQKVESLGLTSRQLVIQEEIITRQDQISALSRDRSQLLNEVLRIQEESGAKAQQAVTDAQNELQAAVAARSVLGDSSKAPVWDAKKVFGKLTAEVAARIERSNTYKKVVNTYGKQ
jgi:predicted  nucleic acid-binding Zn-ribbon protein